MYYFESKERQNELFNEMESWLETPFKHRCCVKHLGCDCIHFVAGVFTSLGLCDIKKIKVPNYPKDWHLHNTREILAEAIEKEFNVLKICLTGSETEEGLLRNGDIILAHYGQASSHSGIYFNGYIYQALNDIGIKKIRFNDHKLKKGFKFCYRIISSKNKIGEN